MMILNLPARTTKQQDCALPFTTDAEVVAAWDWLVANHYLRDFSYRPQAEGADVGRALLEIYLKTYRQNRDHVPALDAPLIRAILESLCEDDLQHSAVTLIQCEPQPHLNGRDLPACSGVSVSDNAV